MARGATALDDEREGERELPEVARRSERGVGDGQRAAQPRVKDGVAGRAAEHWIPDARDDSDLSGGEVAGDHCADGGEHGCGGQATRRFFFSARGHDVLPLHRLFIATPAAHNASPAAMPTPKRCSVNQVWRLRERDRFVNLPCAPWSPGTGCHKLSGWLGSRGSSVCCDSNPVLPR